LEIKTIHDVQSFTALEKEWDCFLKSAKTANVHLQYSWLKTWLDFLGDYKNTLLLVASDNGGIKGIAPLYTDIIYLKGIIPYRQIKFIGDGLSDWGDFIVNDDTTDLINDFFRTISALSWGEIILHNLPYNSPILGYLKTSNIPGLKIKKSTECYYIDFQGLTREEYFKKSVSHKFVVRDLNRIYNHLKNHQWNFGIVENKDILSELDVFAKMHDQSQIRKKRNFLILESSSIFNFYRNALNRLNKSGDLKVFYLNIEGEIAAQMITFYYNNSLYWWNTGFSQKFSKFSPSKVLLNEVINFCFDNNINQFNFMRGDSDYKKKWTKTFTNNYQVRILSNKGIYKFLNSFRNIE